MPYHSFFFFNDTATTEIYTLSLHDALPICRRHLRRTDQPCRSPARRRDCSRPLAERRKSTAEHRRRDLQPQTGDRKSTRLNSSHLGISYAVFCLKKKSIVRSR